jgi:peptidyl-prolyl cis-trans isomerase C
MKNFAKHSALSISAALSLVLAAPLYAQDSDAAPAEEAAEAPSHGDVSADTVLAKVNGENITLGHVISARLSLPQQYQSLPDDVLLNGLVEQLIQQTVLSQAMGEMSRRSQIQLENERRAIIAGEKLDAVAMAAVTDEAIQAAYDADYSSADPTKEWDASHILVKTEEEALALIEELNAGADFAELAKEKSTGPSGPSGGELGWFGPNMMVKEFEDAVSTLKVGDVAGPVQTQFGWHVIKLNDTRMKSAPTIDAVRDEIVAKLKDDAVQKALTTLMDAAKIDRTDISTIDPTVLSDQSMLN